MVGAASRCRVRAALPRVGCIATECEDSRGGELLWLAWLIGERWRGAGVRGEDESVPSETRGARQGGGCQGILYSSPSTRNLKP